MVRTYPDSFPVPIIFEARIFFLAAYTARLLMFGFSKVNAEIVTLWPKMYEDRIVIWHFCTFRLNALSCSSIVDPYTSMSYVWHTALGIPSLMRWTHFWNISWNLKLSRESDKRKICQWPQKSLPVILEKGAIAKIPF